MIIGQENICENASDILQLDSITGYNPKDLYTLIFSFWMRSRTRLSYKNEKIICYCEVQLLTGVSSYHDL